MNPAMDDTMGRILRNGKVVSTYCWLCKEKEPMPYMVKIALWEQTGLAGIVCVRCFQQKLGRQLIIEDFNDSCIWNKCIRYGYELGQQDDRNR